MYPHHLTLSFEGRRLQGVRPFAVFECNLDGVAWQIESDDFPVPDPALGPLQQLRQALASSRRRFGPQGAAMGYIAYDFARLLEPRAFGSQLAQCEELPLARLVFYEAMTQSRELVRDGAPAQSVTRQPPRPAFECATSDEVYEADIAALLAYIADGDIYQANLTRRFSSMLTCTPEELYRRLSGHPMPFSALLQWPDLALVCNSPERFIRVRGDQVTCEPIKGTLARGSDNSEDTARAKQLAGSAKDRAENVMIVDLLRNDLGRVCRYGSVRVPQLCQVRTFPTLHHLVSVVEGRLRPECDAVAAFAAAFPCGSITGAPKIRAMQILDEIEPVARGPAMGAIGYFGFDGDADWNVAIRTIICRGDRAFFHVGGGIVADSRPRAERAEIELKATAIANALSRATI